MKREQEQKAGRTNNIMDQLKAQRLASGETTPIFNLIKNKMKKAIIGTYEKSKNKPKDGRHIINPELYPTGFDYLTIQNMERVPV